jgi:hypothetical protein
MSTTTETAGPVPWWREPTKDQWFAYMAGNRDKTPGGVHFRLERRGGV